MESGEIVTKIINMMLCQKCLKHLYNPVKTNISDGLIYCSRCFDNSEDKSDFQDCLYLNKIGELLEFPCYFKEYGCREMSSWKESKFHEYGCPFRQYKCPSVTSCSWSGTPTNLRNHYTSVHSGLLTSPLELDFDGSSSTNYLVEDLGELFVFQLSSDVEEDMVWCAVRFLGPPQRAARYHFRIEFFTNETDQHYIERKEVGPDDSWTVDKTASIGIRIGMLQAVLKKSAVILVKVKMDVRKPLYNGHADEALMHEVECPVCKDHMLRPIRMCISGHSICNDCFQKLRECPTCRGKFCDTRNISLETLSEQMHYRCMYFDEGCTFTDVPDNIKEHEVCCEISYYDCPLKQFMNCKWRGKVGDVCIHAHKEHQFSF